MDDKYNNNENEDNEGNYDITESVSRHQDELNNDEGCAKEKIVQVPLNSNSHNYAITSLVLGVSAVVFDLICCCTYFSWVMACILGITGIIFGILSKKNNGSKEGMAIAGLICSIIGIFLAIIMIIVAVSIGILNE